MGMFTRVYIDVLEPDEFVRNNVEVQFKTGNDECESYKIGDKLIYEIGPNDPHSDIFCLLYTSPSPRD